MTDDDTDDTLTFNMKNTFIFRPDLSNGLTGNEIITSIHPLIAVTISVTRILNVMSNSRTFSIGYVFGR